MHAPARRFSQGSSYHQFVGSSSRLLSWSCLLGPRALDDFIELVAAGPPICASRCAARTHNPNGDHLASTDRNTDTFSTSVGVPLSPKQTNTTMNLEPPQPPHVEHASVSAPEPQPATAEMPPPPPNAAHTSYHPSPAYIPMDPTEDRQRLEPELKADGAELTTPSIEEEPIAKSEPLHAENPTASQKNVTSEVAAGTRDIFDDLSSLGLTLDDLTPSEKVLTGLEVRKPKKDEWVRCHLETAVKVNIYQPSNTQETYLILPEALEAMGDVVRHVNMTLTVTYAGEAFIWPVPVPLGRSPHKAHLSAAAAARSATKQWIRIAWKGSDYEVSRRTGNPKAPEWPTEVPTAADMLRFACKPGGVEIIETTEHPVVRELLGLD